jgi:hypothetical protein
LYFELNQNTVEIKEIVNWWGKNQVAENCRSAILTTFDANLHRSGSPDYWLINDPSFSSTLVWSVYRGPEGSNCQAHRARIKEYGIRNLTTTISQKNPKNKTD